MLGHETPMSYGGMHTQGVTQYISPETANCNLKKQQIFVWK